MTAARPAALVTGVGRTIGIGAGIATQLAASGWDIAFTYWTAYDQTPLGRLGTPQDTAHLVDFLCSPQGGWINGQLLMSNGGFA